MMKAQVIRAYYDKNGLHKVGENVEVGDVRKLASLVKPLEVEAETTEEKPKKKPTKKTKKG